MRIWSARKGLPYDYEFKHSMNQFTKAELIDVTHRGLVFLKLVILDSFYTYSLNLLSRVVDCGEGLLHQAIKQQQHDKYIHFHHNSALVGLHLHCCTVRPATLMFHFVQPLKLHCAQVPKEGLCVSDYWCHVSLINLCLNLRNNVDFFF